VYTGSPSTVSWLEPSERLIVPNDAVTDAALLCGASDPGTGGQYVAHEPVHVEWPELSLAKPYNVIPFGSTSTFPKEVVPTETVPDEAGLCPPDDEELPP